MTETMDMEGVPPALRPLMGALAGAAAQIATRIARGPLTEALGAAVEGGGNADGDAQKALDMIADDIFRTAVQETGLRWFASEEREAAELIDPEGALALAIDPLDGSSNIDVNVAVGTIFSVRPAGATPEKTYLGPGRGQIAAGYVIYGPSCQMVACFGGDVRRYVLDAPAGRFRLVEAAMRLPAASNEFAINASNYRHWEAPVRAYVDDCIAGAEGPTGRNFNMRWVASLVAEAHRIMTRGGIFLYPGDKRPGYGRGRLRMVYECAPMAMLVEAAGGGATDGVDRLLDRGADGLHSRSPLVFGSAPKVARAAAYHDLPQAEVSALFGARGLFRA